MGWTALCQDIDFWWRAGRFRIRFRFCAPPRSMWSGRVAKWRRHITQQSIKINNFRSGGGTAAGVQKEQKKKWSGKCSFTCVTVQSHRNASDSYVLQLKLGSRVFRLKNCNASRSRFILLIFRRVTFMNCRAEKVAQEWSKKWGQEFHESPESPESPKGIKPTCGGLLTLSALLGPSGMGKSSETINHSEGRITRIRKSCDWNGEKKQKVKV